MLDPQLFSEIMPQTEKKVPILISIPHAGTAFPSSQVSYYQDGIVNHPEDTDWLVHELYDFAPEIGITVIKANYSRYVVDLNRDPQNKSLYKDARLKTQVLPTVTFDRRSIYRDEKYPDQISSERIKNYHTPYYQRIDAILKEFQKDFKHCLFFDAHSIKRTVASIQENPFVDLIIGTRDQTSCAKEIGELTYNHFKDVYTTSLNTPFKGGNLTQTFGKPKDYRHAIQLEMSQDIYLEHDRILLSKDAIQLKTQLKDLFIKLSEWLKNKNL
jgi:formiminoglutamase